jgi:hypothetical protein
VDRLWLVDARYQAVRDRAADPLVRAEAAGGGKAAVFGAGTASGARAMTELVPIAETIEVGEAYSCSRSLFSFVNRSLNLIELQAAVLHIKNDTVIFRVVQRASD